ncbi:MAG: nitroreductase family protein [Clostridia bacterium]|nr:nitroreductase family protein [Clostridia bacterium]
MNMKKWYKAAEERCSIRKYSAPPTDYEITQLIMLAEQISGNGIRIEVMREEDVFSTGLIKQVITGTDCFAAIIEKNTAQPFMTGYIGEAFVLECTLLGLGTCWLGASYKRSAVLSKIDLSEDEKLRCIISIGRSGQEFSRRKRKNLRQLMKLDSEDFDREIAQMAPWQLAAIKCAQIAPTAINAQPFMLEVLENSVCVMNTGWNFGYGMVDCGIAMLHIEAGAAFDGVFGKWVMKDNVMRFESISED